MPGPALAPRAHKVLSLDNTRLKRYTYGLISLVIKGCGHLDLPHQKAQGNAGKPLPVPYQNALISLEKNTGPSPLYAGSDLIQEEMNVI